MLVRVAFGSPPQHSELARRLRWSFVHSIAAPQRNLWTEAMNDKPSGSTIAIFVWGDVIEQWLDTIGLTTKDFAERMTGGWIFGYVAALRHAGWQPIIVIASRQARTTTRLIHSSTGAPIWLVPGTPGYRTGRSPNFASIRSWLNTPLRAFREVVEREECRALLIQEYEYTRFDALVRLAHRLGIPAYATFRAETEHFHG